MSTITSTNILTKRKRPVQKGKTRKVCLICLDEPEEPVVLHKTNRQVHVMCEDCAAGFIGQRLQALINAKDYTFPPKIGCSGNPYGQRRNQCRHSFAVTQEKFGRLQGVNDLLTKIALLANPTAVACPKHGCGNIFFSPTRRLILAVESSLKSNVMLVRLSFVVFVRQHLIILG